MGVTLLLLMLNNDFVRVSCDISGVDAGFPLLEKRDSADADFLKRYTRSDGIGMTIDSVAMNLKHTPREDLGMEQVGDELVILDKRNQKIHQLNATASAIWGRLLDGKAATSIVQEIVDDFDISCDVASDDVARLLKEFYALELLKGNYS